MLRVGTFFFFIVKDKHYQLSLLLSLQCNDKTLKKITVKKNLMKNNVL